MTRSRRGMTLVEIVVAMGVLMVVMTASLSIFLPSLGRFQKVDMEYDSQRSALLAVERVAQDLKEGRMSGVNYQPLPNFLLVIPSPRDGLGVYRTTAADGTPDWQTWIVYWTVPDPHDATARSLRRAVMPGPVAIGTPFTPPAARMTARDGREVASGLSSIVFSARTVNATFAVARIDASTVRSFQRVVANQDRSTIFVGSRSIEILN